MFDSNTPGSLFSTIWIPAIFFTEILILFSTQLDLSHLVHLARGRTANEGRVIVRPTEGAEWGTVCDDHWDLTDANVVCRQLGYSKALYAFGSAHFGEGWGNISMNHVNCTGEELSIQECPHSDDAVCGHHQDASVICEPNGKLHRLFFVQEKKCLAFRRGELNKYYSI